MRHLKEVTFDDFFFKKTVSIYSQNFLQVFNFYWKILHMFQMRYLALTLFEICYL